MVWSKNISSYQLHQNIFFFFLLFHQLADDEVLIIFLQTSLFLVFPYAVDQGWRTFFRSRANILKLENRNILACHAHFLLHSPLLYHKNLFNVIWSRNKVNVSSAVVWKFFRRNFFILQSYTYVVCTSVVRRTFSDVLLY